MTPLALRAIAIACALLLATLADASDARHDALSTWSDALHEQGPLQRERRRAIDDARLALARARFGMQPSWSLRQDVGLGFGGGWDLTLNGRLEVPIQEPALARRRDDARGRVAMAELNARLAHRDALSALWSDLIGWRRVDGTSSLVDRALARAPRLPVSRDPALQDELGAWARFADELDLERSLLRRRLRARTGLDPELRETPRLLADAGLRTLLARAPAETLDACLDREPNVQRTSHALRRAVREQGTRASATPRVALVVAGDLRVEDDGAQGRPSASAGASLRLDVALPTGAPLRAGMEASLAPDRMRFGARLSGPSEPPHVRQTVEDARRGRDEARFEARVWLQRAALERRHLREAVLPVDAPGPSRSARDWSEELVAPIANARDLRALLIGLEGSVAQLSRRAKLAGVAAELAAACAP